MGTATVDRNGKDVENPKLEHFLNVVGGLQYWNENLNVGFEVNYITTKNQTS